MEYHQQQRTAAGQQLLSDCRCNLRLLTFAVNTLIESLPAEYRNLCESFTDCARGSIDNLQTSVEVAIDLVADDQAPAPLQPGDLLRGALAAEMALLVGPAFAAEQLTEDQAATVNERCDQLQATAEQLAHQVAGGSEGRDSATAAAEQMRTVVDQLIATLQADGSERATDDQRQQLESLIRAMPDAIKIGTDNYRQGLRSWRDAMRQLNAPAN